jgi:tetratricopeptide (TPR) repeat protein
MAGVAAVDSGNAPGMGPDRALGRGEQAGAEEGLGVYSRAVVPHDGSRPTVPRELPVAPAPLVGRAAELAQMDDAVARQTDRRALIMLTGVGGVGKTALAVSWAHQVRRDYPNGQLYVNLGAFDPGGPVTSGDALGRFLRALGVPPDGVPNETGERSALFRSLSSDRALVIVLDNAMSAAQVRPLLPASAGCVVVVTSRWQLAGLTVDGAQLLTVPPLAVEAATDLLRRLAGADRVAGEMSSAMSVARLCGGLPLALSVAGARLASRPHWPVGRMLSELEPGHRRLKNLSVQEDLAVRPVFDVSYHELPAAAARCYRLLGLHPGPEFGPGVAAAALTLAEDDTLDLLETLVDASLLTETREGRYRYHDLVRLHAAEKAVSDEDGESRDNATRRMLEWYLAGARAADRIITPYRRPRRPYHYLKAAPVVDVPEGREGALGWLERERVSLVAAVRHAAEQELYDLAWHLDDAMWPLFNYRRHHQDRLVVDGIGVDSARRLGNRDYESKVLKRLALAFLNTGRLEEAAAEFSHGLVLCEQIDDRHGAAGNLEGLGFVALAQHDHAAATDCFTRALEMFEALGKPRHIAKTLLNLGTAQLAAGDPPAAVVLLERALAGFEQFRETDPFNRARALCQLGCALGQTGDVDRARSVLGDALSEMTRLRSPHGQANVRRAQGELAITTGEPALAQALLNQALALYTGLGDTEAAETARLLEQIDG